MMVSKHKESLIEVCQILAEQQHLQVTVKSAAKSALITGVGAFFGALIAGPIGVAVGGTLASVTTAVATKGTYKSVVDILKNDLTPDQQGRLAASVGKNNG
ncbi:hypothetical protein NQ318_000932 [Aromia moschata]|uniref:Uncharacterized protein n=1 Tax=Aromia moschata TaxID=1265417 RepID=A0AAV8ZF07_9CUCU|nr:hypothetical protein NQ318_000932 [Aromia moschata]